MIYHHRDGAQARSSPPRGRGTLGQRYEDDSLSFVAIKKVSSPLARTPTREGSGAQSAFRMLDIARARMVNMHGALEQKHKGVPMLAPAPEPEVLNKEPELAAIVAAPGGAPNGPISSTRSDQAEDDVRIVTAPGGRHNLFRPVRGRTRWRSWRSSTRTRRRRRLCRPQGGRRTWPWPWPWPWS